jgi:hypothetical protein
MTRILTVIAALMLTSCAGMAVSTERSERATPGAQYSQGASK